MTDRKKEEDPSCQELENLIQGDFVNRILGSTIWGLGNWGKSNFNLKLGGWECCLGFRPN